MRGRLTLMLRIEKVSSRRADTVDSCIGRLLEGATVVVETQRLKHLIEDGYNRAKLSQGETSWPSAEVYVWQLWLSKLWFDLEDYASGHQSQLLSAAQSMQIWERAIAEDIQEEYSEEFEYLLWHITATAVRAKSAFGLMCSYKIDQAEFGDHLSQDVQHFLRWMRNYLNRLKSSDWVDLESVPDMLCRQACDILDLSNGRIVFAGFDRWTVQHQNLLESLSEHGEVERLDYETASKPRRVEQIEFERVDDEIELCARWARAVIEANPEVHRVGIVAPRLDGLYGKILRQFSGVLNPDKMMDKRELQQLSFHVTMGTGLIETPLVIDALNLLELIRPEVDVSVLCSVIQSDRIRGWESEHSDRAALKEIILGIGHSKLSLEDVENLIETRSLRCKQLSWVLAEARKLLSGMPKYADYAHWGGFFMDWMKNFQSEKRENRDFGTNEMQAHESWSSAVESLAELGIVSSKVQVETAVAKLRRMISEINVQPRAVSVPIQVGGMISLAGQSFTHLWILGMNNDALPGSPRPNPFIPVSLQKDRGIPESSASLLEQSVSEQIERTLGSAVDVVQSYAVSDGSSYFQPSSLLGNLEKVDTGSVGEIGVYPNYWQRIFQDRSHCRQFVDWEASKVDSPAAIYGGSSILRNQSRCPFRAFAEHRLHVGQPESSNIGISALDRGTLVHKMFEKIYSKITVSHLIADESGRQNYMRVAHKKAQKVMKKFVAKQIKPISEELAEAEIERMVDLARQWLAVEVKRSEFTVSHRETRAEASFSGLPVKMRIDRIDETPGGRVIIDYKTGQCSINDTTGARPRDPQLLIYECALEQQGEQVGNIAYAKVKRGDVRFLPRSDKLREEYPVEESRSRLDEIARDFLEGKADVDPLPGVCDHCHVYSICRKDDRSDGLAAQGLDTA